VNRLGFTAGVRRGLKSGERKRFKAQERELRRVNGILGKAVTFFARAELERPAT